MTKLLQSMLFIGTFFYISLGNLMGQTFKDLTIGNRYVYISKNIKISTPPMQNTYSTSSTQIFMEEVTKDSVINGVRYYKITNSLNTQVKWERSDSLGIYLWSTNSHKEYPSYSLTMGIIDVRGFDSSETASYSGLTKGGIYFGGFDCSQAQDFCSFFYIRSLAVRKSSTNVDMGMTFIESVKLDRPNWRTITYQNPIGILSVSDTWVVTASYSPRPGAPIIIDIIKVSMEVCVESS